MKKCAVVMFNLGGPDGPEAVQPFLFNLFNDAAIIGVPQPIRWLLAKFISKKRAPFAQEIYQHIGGKSPLLDLTNEQAQALESVLSERLAGVDVKTFVSMRYWHPFSDQVAGEVKAYAPDQIVLLPLYPQFSTTTSASSLEDWDLAAKKVGLDVPTKRVCCYPVEPGFIKAQVDLLKASLTKAGDNVRVLFSAHGLPKKIVDQKGDPYPDHVERGAQAIVDELTNQGITLDDWRVCYQSRVGPLEWIGPATEDEIARAGSEGKALVVLPLAFVSEHSETLVELDIEYGELAEQKGVATYVRVPAVGTHAEFISGLGEVVAGALSVNADPSPQGGVARLCPTAGHACPARTI
ncbi:ferrochelatase [Pseudomonadota bacterium]